MMKIRVKETIENALGNIGSHKKSSCNLHQSEFYVQILLLKQMSWNVAKKIKKFLFAKSR